MTLAALVFAQLLLQLVGLALFCAIVLKARSILHHIAMDIDSYIDSLEDDRSSVDDGDTPSSPQSTANCHRTRLAAVVAGGQSRELLGKNYTTTYIEEADADEIDRLYSRYETRIGGQVSKALGTTLISIYTKFLSRVVPIDSAESLAEDLENDVFIKQALSAATCEAYYRFGYLLAPLTTAAITMAHVERLPTRTDIPTQTEDDRSDTSTSDTGT